MKYFVLITIFVLAGFLVLETRANDHNGRKIVVFQSGLNEAAKDEIIAHAGGAKLKPLDLIEAKAVWLPSRAAATKLKAHPSVLRVDDDVVVEALGFEDRRASESNFRSLGRRITQAVQVLPWGIDRIDAERVWPTGNTADPIKVGVIDTGIAKDHPDLKANLKGGVNTINPRKSWNDDNGHGSHVAGIIASLNNTIGVVGVGPSADLYAIKVLNASGSGYLSDVIEGIEWSIAKGMKVINMSLGTSADVQSFRDAVVAAKSAGIVVVAAAGNSGGAVLYPAAYPETIAVSATDQNNVIANWSSRGPEVDLASPGVSIYSTYKGTGYKTLSGTSMAAPHVTGVVALLLNTAVGAWDSDGDGKWDPAEVESKLESRATDLGPAGNDNLYGWGLVNAWAAVQP